MGELDKFKRPFRLSISRPMAAQMMVLAYALGYRDLTHLAKVLFARFVKEAENDPKLVELRSRLQSELATMDAWDPARIINTITGPVIAPPPSDAGRKLRYNYSDPRTARILPSDPHWDGQWIDADYVDGYEDGPADATPADATPDPFGISDEEFERQAAEAFRQNRERSEKREDDGGAGTDGEA